MIPFFPKFKLLEWNDKNDVEQFTNEFPPYSDYNFVSMWSWNTRKKMQVSQLNENLVLLFYDYVTETPFLSFIGKHNLDDTALKLIDYSIQHYNTGTLKLIPKTVANQLRPEKLTIAHDIDAHDYIISTEYLSSLADLKTSRRSDPAAYFCQKFLQQYPLYSVKISSANEIIKSDYLDVFKRWAKVKGLDHQGLNEYSAFERFVYNTETANYYVSMYDGNTMMGFATFEIVSADYAIYHFSKADILYPGIYDCLHYVVGRALKERNVSYWNFEQDLGLPGLRRAKQKYNPAFFLEKYTVSKI